MVNIAFTGGGTGGHIYPGLAVASGLKQFSGSQCSIFWIGSSRGNDSSIIKNAGLEFFGVPSGKLRRYFSLITIVDFFRLIAGFFASRRILKQKKAAFLFSKGGYVSVPPCAAAYSLGIRIFTHESDFSPGLATKINSRFVYKSGGKIFVSYNETIRFFSDKFRDSIILSGNPVRDSFRNTDAVRGRSFLGLENDSRILLVLGGSLGAREINELVRAALHDLTRFYTVVHQTGPESKWDLQSGAKYRPYPYISDEMPDVLAAAELVLCRSGAGTVWECAVCGKPMLLVPLAGSATRGDQLQNALFFEQAGAALVFTGKTANPRTLVDAVTELAHNEDKRARMSASSLKTTELDGTGVIVRVLAGEIPHNKGAYPLEASD
ncbi:MAG: undecaprenyldiphospho-muramoylpentapeptide beta-N-acetylglucosaminyltransferase [Treponema sp.]|jgi:UDP-N-acetylglucosamine--N-acetylmuramyl-(pentapeptide) pyrophosphoryl-undecaprenol N-acetylglucosamine transferase|nr:undecaprenyldiphospho-muramoylpentapeptide beta-N-acetylglucosaminyltransferase [Treponema sp.]